MRAHRRSSDHAYTTTAPYRSALAPAAQPRPASPRRALPPRSVTNQGVPLARRSGGSFPRRLTARIGQKNKITRRWAKRGTRPSAPTDQRTASAYIFGAICPKQGKGVALILPACNTEAMNLHLAEIAKAVAPGAHAVL